MFYTVLLGGQLTWNIPLVVGLTCIAVLYSFFVKRDTRIPLTRLQPLLFFLGLVLLYLATGSPLSTISHLSFSLHMIQMSLLYFIVPPFILLGIPEPIFKQIYKLPMIKKGSKRLLRPKTALYIFATLFLMYHLPFALDILSQNAFIQNGYLFLLFLLSFSIWWPITSPDLKQRLHGKQMKRYVFRSGLLLMPACVFFMLTALTDGMNNPFLTQITSQLCIPSGNGSLQLLPPPFNTEYDQLMAGIFMLGIHKFGIMLSLRLGNKMQG
ncbi:cytochrome c oxidase assembly protein [Virgibacillus natechei]